MAQELSEQLDVPVADVLMRLGDQGLLESKWEPSPQAGRPPRHVYRLTPAGANLAREQASARVDGGLEEPLGNPA